MLRFDRLLEPLDPSKQYIVLEQEEYSSNFRLLLLQGSSQEFLGGFSISHFQYKSDILMALRMSVTDILNKASTKMDFTPSSWLTVYFAGHYNLLWCTKEFEGKMKRLSIFNLNQKSLAFMLEDTKFA